MEVKSRHKLYGALVFTCALGACGSSDSETDTSVSVDDTTETTTPDTGVTSTALVVNEIVASPEGESSDWIELFATSDINDLSIYSVSDDNASRIPQALPAISMAAGDFVVIQAIDEEDTPPADGYYVTFKLGGDDAVYLYENDNLVSELDWEEGDAEEGYSYGLYIDGTGSPQTLLPTQGAANQEFTGTVVTADKITDNDAELRINEIVAKNANDGEDWIEFYVTSDDAVFLGDYSVTDDDGELFSLPDVTLSSGEFYRVYATDEEIEGESTVDFKLGSSDSVSLYLATDLIDQLSWNKGDALIGFSFGRYPDGSDAIATLTPSALTNNIQAVSGPLVINEIVATQNDDSADWFELYNNSSNEISLIDYQVIDSSDDIEAVTLPDIVLAPGEHQLFFASDDVDSEEYVGFKLGKEDELSLLKEGETVDFIQWQDSDVPAGYSYGLIEEGSWSKNTLSPTPSSSNQIADVYSKDAVESIHFEIDEGEWQDLLDNAEDEEYHLTSVTYKGAELDEVAIRTKGNSSLDSVIQLGSERFSFNIDVNEYVDGQTLLGMKKFVLNNMYNDPSYMREYIAYDLLDEMGVPTPEHSYVNVYVNDELIGLYLLVEFVNKDFITKYFSNTEGDLYKPDGTGSDLVYIDDNFSSYSGVELKTNEDSSDNGAFLDFVSAMAFGDGLSTINSDSILRYLTVSVALSNLDSYQGSLAHNYYIYEQDNVFSILPWDLNESFGSFNQGCNGVDIRGLYIDEPTSGALSDRPLLATVLADSDNITAYHNYLTQLIENSLSSNDFAARIASIDELISEHVLNDPTAFYSFSEYEQNQTSSVGRFYGLTEFMAYRVDNITQQLNGTIASSGNGNGYCSR